MKRYFTFDRLLLGGTILIWILYMLWLPLWTQDGANHKQVLNLLSQYSSDPTLQNLFQINIGFLHTNQFFHVLYLKVFNFISMEAYEKLFFVFFVLLQILGFRFFLKNWNEGDFQLWPLILPFSFHLLYMRGFYNFMAAFALSLFFLGFAKRAIEQKKMIDLIIANLLLILIFWAHPFPFFILIPCCFLLLFRTNSSVQKIIATELILISFFFWSVGFLKPLLQVHEAVNSSSSLLYYAPWELLGGLFVFNFSLYKIWEVFFYIPFFLAYLWLAYYSLRHLSWTYKIFWILCLAGYFVFPKEGKGGGIINERFLPFLLCFIPIGIHFSIQKKKFLIRLAFITWVISLVFVGKGSIASVQDRKEAKSILSELPLHAKIYPMVFDPYGPGLNYAAHTHLWAAAPFDKKILSSSLFVYSPLMPLSPKGQSFSNLFPSAPEYYPNKARECIFQPLNCEGSAEYFMEKILEKAKIYEYWYLYNPPPEILKRLVLEKNWQEWKCQGKSYLWQNTQYEKPKI